MPGAGESERPGAAGGPGADEALAPARERLLAELPAGALELVGRFEQAVRADERRLSALRYAGGRSAPPTPDQALGAALAAEAAEGPLTYCGPEELMRLLVAELEEDEA